MDDLLNYIKANYHILTSEHSGLYKIDTDYLKFGICYIINSLECNDIKQWPEPIFINSVERKTKYIVLEDKHYIILDCRQIVECAYASMLITLINGDIDFTISVPNEADKNEIKASVYHYSTEEHTHKLRICNFYSLADLCFSMGYVDASVKNLTIAKNIKDDFFPQNRLKREEIEELTYRAQIIGVFMYLHELVHYMLKEDYNFNHQANSFSELLNLILERYNNGQLSREWKRNTKQYGLENSIRNYTLANLFEEFQINKKFPFLHKFLQKNILSWREFCLEKEKWNIYSKELICDIVAINMLMKSKIGKEEHYLLSIIIRCLLVQETYSLQNNLLNYCTQKKKEISTLNIKRVQLIFATLIIDNFNRKCLGWEPIIKNLHYEYIDFDDLINDICCSVEIAFENQYLYAIEDFFRSLLSENLFRRYIKCAYYITENSKDFVFTDDYQGKHNPNRYITSYDAILLQKDILIEYDKFERYVFGYNIYIEQ